MKKPKVFNVSYSYTINEECTITARNEKEARNKALEVFNEGVNIDAVWEIVTPNELAKRPIKPFK